MDMVSNPYMAKQNVFSYGINTSSLEKNKAMAAAIGCVIPKLVPNKAKGPPSMANIATGVITTFIMIPSSKQPTKNTGIGHPASIGARYVPIILPIPTVPILMQDARNTTKPTSTFFNTDGDVALMPGKNNKMGKMTNA